MAKRIKNPVETRIVEDDGTVKVSIHYGTECEYGDLGRRGFEPQLTSAEQTAVEQVAARSKELAKEHEGIE